MIRSICVKNFFLRPHLRQFITQAGQTYLLIYEYYFTIFLTSVPLKSLRGVALEKPPCEGRLQSVKKPDSCSGMIHYFLENTVTVSELHDSIPEDVQGCGDLSLAYVLQPYLVDQFVIFHCDNHIFAPFYKTFLLKNSFS